MQITGHYLSSCAAGKDSDMTDWKQVAPVMQGQNIYEACCYGLNVRALLNSHVET